MAYSSPPPPLHPAAPPPPVRPPRQLPPPQPDTTLTLALALPPPPLVCPLSGRPPQHARRPRPDGAASSSVLARVRSSSSPTGDAPPCTECGKRFPSLKALFGHMRCHPERLWRGITPPHFRHGALGAPLAVAAADQLTDQEREVATSLLMLTGKHPGGAGKGKKGIPASSCANVSGSTSTSSPTAPEPARCDDHKKCSAVSVETGQAPGGHKRCHWERECTDQVMVVATYSSCRALPTSEAAAPTALDLNLPPSGTPLPHKSEQGSSFNPMLDLKLGY